MSDQQSPDIKIQNVPDAEPTQTPASPGSASIISGSESKDNYQREILAKPPQAPEPKSPSAPVAMPPVSVSPVSVSPISEPPVPTPANVLGVNAVSQTQQLQTNISNQTSPVENVSNLDPLALSTRVTELYRAMKGGITGIGTNERALFRALEGLSAQDILSLEAGYKSKYGRDLRADIKSEIGQDKRFLDRAEPLLTGDKLGSMLAGIRLECSIPTTQTGEIIRLLKDNLDPSQTAEIIEQAYTERYGGSLRSDLVSKLNSNDQALAQALLNHDATEIQAREIISLVSGAKPSERQEIISEINHLIGADDITGVSERLLTSANLMSLTELKRLTDPVVAEYLAARLEGKFDLAQAIRTNDALKNSPNVSQVLQEIFSENNPAGVLAAYKEKFGQDLIPAITALQRLNTEQKSILVNLANSGQINDADAIVLALYNRPPRVQPVLELVHSKTAAEIALMNQQYELSQKQSLEAALSQRLRGSDRFDARLGLVGKPENAQEDVMHITATHEFERRGRNIIPAKALDLCSRQGKVYDKHISEVNAIYNQNKVSAPEFDGEDDSFQLLMGYVEEDLETYRDAKSKLANLFGLLMGALGALASFLTLQSPTEPLWKTTLIPLIVAVLVKILAEGSFNSRWYTANHVLTRVKTQRGVATKSLDKTYQGINKRRQSKLSRRRELERGRYRKNRLR